MKLFSIAPLPPILIWNITFYVFFQLSHYLDVVEVQIAKQISLKSEAFFHAMTSHDQLQANLTSTNATVAQLRFVVTLRVKFT